MIVSLLRDISDSDLANIQAVVLSLGIELKLVTTQSAKYLVGVSSREFDIRKVGHLTGVKDVHRIVDPWKLVSASWRVGATEINLSDEVKIKSGELTLMAGPCSVESEDQIAEIARFLAGQGVRIMRGGAFKPRSSPYSFRGLGIPGLKFFYEIAKENGLKVISEVLEKEQIEQMYPYTDIFQVGARNSQNFSLLDALGNIDKPVLIKRGMSGTLEELLQSAEYVYSGGNEKLILCERGIRTYEKAYRNTLDLNSVPWLKEKSHLPVIVDPSHGIGIRRFVTPMACAAVASGADGLLVEIHPKPEEALSDGAQSLSFVEAQGLFGKVRILAFQG